MLPLLPFDSSPSMSAAVDGPTVRQHLQFQQAAHKQRLQQELLIKRIRQEEGQKRNIVHFDGNNEFEKYSNFLKFTEHVNDFGRKVHNSFVKEGVILLLFL